MAFSDYQDTIAWRSALELGPRLTQLAEELPASEQHGLAQALRSLALDLPTAVAIDIQTGSNARIPVVLRLQTALKLTDRIYQALDTVAADRALAEVLDRLTGPDIAAKVEPPKPEPVPAPVPVPTSAPLEIPAQMDQPLPTPVLEPMPELDTTGTHIQLTPTDQQ